MGEDGVIKGVESAAYEVPAGCRLTRFDGTMLPGLFDAHVHLVSDQTQHWAAWNAPGRWIRMRSTSSSIGR
jgi:imidazolonepropionase-like amidohydrolase